jgi:hypothetical protein
MVTVRITRVARSALLAVVSGAALLASGCVPSQNIYRELGARASYDLQCDRDEIRYVRLRAGERDGHGAQYGASGCGQRIVYVYVRRGGWVSDTAGGERDAN